MTRVWSQVVAVLHELLDGRSERGVAEEITGEEEGGLSGTAPERLEDDRQALAELVSREAQGERSPLWRAANDGASDAFHGAGSTPTAVAHRFSHTHLRPD